MKPRLRAALVLMGLAAGCGDDVRITEPNPSNSPFRKVTLDANAREIPDRTRATAGQIRRAMNRQLLTAALPVRAIRLPAARKRTACYEPRDDRAPARCCTKAHELHSTPPAAPFRVASRRRAKYGFESDPRASLTFRLGAFWAPDQARRRRGAESLMVEVAVLSATLHNALAVADIFRQLDVRRRLRPTA